MSSDSRSQAFPGLQTCLKRFLEWSASLNYSLATIEKRQISIQRFIEWCEQYSIERPQDITKPVLERYRRHLFHHRKADGQPLSFSTQYSQLTPLKAFFKWLNKENYILYNPASEFELPRVPKRLPKYILTVEEINAMLNHTSVHGAIGIRDRAILETFYSSGVRQAELSNLKIQDADLARGTLTILDGKGKKDRVVPLGERAGAWLRKYRDEVRPTLIRDDDSGYLFVTEHGSPFIGNRASDLVRKYKLAAGIDKPGSSHLFRHAMATHMLENGADIRYIQMILGHANLSSTEIYTQVSIKKLQEVHRATHPAK